jgi:deoxyhypusine synthase
MSIYEKFQPINLDKINTYELASRPSKVTVNDFAAPILPDDSLREFLAKLPDILAVQNLREIALQIRRAKDLGKPVILGIGGHVVKTGLAPIIIDLMKQGFVSAIAANGSVLVHDTEIALIGFTSEDVDATLGKGDFGAAKETGEILNSAAKRGASDKIGLGEAMGREVSEQNVPNAEKSLLCQTYKHKIPFTTHLTIGADIGHFHASCDGASLGAATHTDFKLFCSIVKELNGGGVYVNLGSAVTMPEIFLKAVTVVRNLGYDLQDFTTANFDFIQHYRPLTNVVRRPTANGAGRGFSVTGHHEIMIPLLAAHILCGQ